MARIVVVGKNSFLGQRFLALTRHSDVTAISHDELDRPGLFDGAICVLNFALDPRMMREPYAESRDLDLAIADKLRDRSARLVMMSSRMVYGPEQAHGAREDVPATGLNQYGKNKLETEARLRDRLVDRVVVLRVANVLAWAPSTGHRSFMLQVLDRLAAEGRISYDISPFVRKDFVTEQYFGAALDRACDPQTLAGTYNVGSGIPLEVGHIAMWVLSGLGRGELHITSPRVVDEFWLDTTKATAVFGPSPTQDALRVACIELGRKVSQ